MVPAGYIEALVQFAESQGSDSELIIERNKAWEAIKSGDSGELTNMNVNGQSFTWSGTVSIEEKFTALSQALRLFKGDTVTSTRPDFRNLTH